MPSIEVDLDSFNDAIAQELRTMLDNGMFSIWDDAEELTAAAVVMHNWFCYPKDAVKLEDYT